MSMLIIEVPNKECNYKETRQLPPDLINYIKFDGFDHDRYLFYPPDGEVRIRCPGDPYPNGLMVSQHPDRPNYIMITYRIKGVPYRELVAVIKDPVRCDRDYIDKYYFPLGTYEKAKKEGQFKISGVPLKILYSNNWPKIFFSFRYKPENLFLANTDHRPIFILDEQEYYTSEDRRRRNTAFDQDAVLITIPYSVGGLIANYPVILRTAAFLQERIEGLIESKNLEPAYNQTLLGSPYAGWDREEENYEKLKKIGLEAAIEEMPDYVESCVREVSDNLAYLYNKMLRKIWNTYNDFLNGLALSKEKEDEEEN